MLLFQGKKTNKQRHLREVVAVDVVAGGETVAQRLVEDVDAARLVLALDVVEVGEERRAHHHVLQQWQKKTR